MEPVALSFPLNSALFAGLLGLMKVWLGLRVSIYRGRKEIPYGDSNDEVLMRRVRAHANFSENVPIALILLVLAEMLHASGILIVALGIVLLIGRLLHWLGLSGNAEPFNRVAGMVMTWGVIGISSIMAIWLYVSPA